MAEYLVDHVPEVEFEPDSWISSLERSSPLYLALTKGPRSLVEKLLNSGKCQRTLDGTVNCPTPYEFLEMYDRHHEKRSDKNDELPAVAGMYCVVSLIWDQIRKFILMILMQPNRKKLHTCRLKFQKKSTWTVYLSCLKYLKKNE